MIIILLSGGSGRRLWPMSNGVRSKQFLKIFRNEDGTSESMVQRMYRNIMEVDSSASVILATSRSQVTSIRAQLGDSVEVSVEPSRRDTFPAILLAVSWLHDIKNVAPGETVVVCPVDTYAESGYFRLLRDMDSEAAKSGANLVLMGVGPRFADDRYGYIVPKTRDRISDVALFREKPDPDAAEKYIEQGALWNAGVFAFRAGYILDIAERMFGSSAYSWLLDNYDRLPASAFDNAVTENETRIRVVRYDGSWSDIGTWENFTESMSDDITGNAMAVDCKNTHVINELQIPLLAVGVKDLAIAATPDGILVTDKKKSERLIDHIADRRPMYEARGWGQYQVLDYRIQDDGQNFLTKHLIISPGQHISYQRHSHRSEIWTFVDGTGRLILDGNVTKVSRGETAFIRPGMMHAIKADTELHIIEVQVGDELTEEDIERLDWDWDSME